MGSTAEMMIPAVVSPPRLTVLRPATKRLGFVAAFEMIGQCIGIYTLQGALLHETAALRDCRRDDNTARLIRTVVDAMSSRALVAIRRQEVPEPMHARDDHRIVRATLYQPSDEPMILVHVNSLVIPHREMSDAEITRRFNLTPAELRVARRLAKGQANKVIAVELCVSEHTVRHQTERVLRKLNVNSRSAVAQKLLSD